MHMKYHLILNLTRPRRDNGNKNSRSLDFDFETVGKTIERIDQEAHDPILVN